MASTIEFFANNSLAFLLCLAAAGVIFFLQFQPTFGAETPASRRLKTLTKNAAIQTKKRQRLSATERRRQLIADGVKQLEADQQQRSSDISVLIEQAGLPWTTKQFHLSSIVIGALAAISVLILSKNIFVAAIAGAVIGYFALRVYANRRRAKRFASFIDELPNALDIVVRGTMVGQHPNACFRTIARDAKEPLRTEFAIVCDAQSVGRPLSEALVNLAARIPCAETNFLAIAVTVTSAHGGSLAEPIRNLSATLRDRKAMRGEIAALSMEGKVSAAIICPLPIFFIGLVYIVSPEFIVPLFTTNTGIMVAVASSLWMAIGGFLMIKMSNVTI
ncbi:pilus assembly protein [Camelimonas fluminis]|uniref:Type II secretion system F family protein n=1 Tax=Camelimonas fluminis TaxID=1576911 RepID=A0ABV7UHI9_9HYPH|nr:type II secretion system F family protein [Camelimonas fluminis]GHE73162.1 pilus assembly protein [Camelimonas fluminis]